MGAEFFEREYHGSPIWEIDGPQPEVVRLADEGELRGTVLDVGCGTGENARFLAARGHRVLGVDFAPTAIDRARERLGTGPPNVTFRVANALDLSPLGERFDTVLDCGTFHTFLDKHRPRYAGSVRSAVRPGGRFFVLCFSELEPTDWGGPRRVSQEELRATFRAGWRERWIREARYATRLPGVVGRSWLAAFEPTEEPATSAPA
jgi:SAM-dependent methyltransferase